MRRARRSGATHLLGGAAVEDVEDAVKEGDVRVRDEVLELLDASKAARDRHRSYSGEPRGGEASCATGELGWRTLGSGRVESDYRNSRRETSATKERIH